MSTSAENVALIWSKEGGLYVYCMKSHSNTDTGQYDTRFAKSYKPSVRPV